jgi:hypothetical protein
LSAEALTSTGSTFIDDYDADIGNNLNLFIEADGNFAIEKELLFPEWEGTNSCISGNGIFQVMSAISG